MYSNPSKSASLGTGRKWRSQRGDCLRGISIYRDSLPVALVNRCMKNAGKLTRVNKLLSPVYLYTCIVLNFGGKRNKEFNIIIYLAMDCNQFNECNECVMYTQLHTSIMQTAGI